MPDPLDRYGLSASIWAGGQAARDQIQAVLTQAIASGEDALVTATKLEQFLDPAYAPIRNVNGNYVRNQPKGLVTQTPGRGGSGSFSARRLTRTEFTAAHGATTREKAATLPYVEGIKWNLSASHPMIDECDDRAQGGPKGDGVYPGASAPDYPAHPQDLCYLTMVLADKAALQSYLDTFLPVDEEAIEIPPIDITSQSEVEAWIKQLAKDGKLTPGQAAGRIYRMKNGKATPEETYNLVTGTLANAPAQTGPPPAIAEPKPPAFKAENAAWDAGLASAQFDQWAATAADDEFTAVEGYKDGQFAAINAELRAGANTPVIQQDIAHITAALESSTTPVDLRVYRGVDLGTGSPLRAQWAAMKPGDVIPDAGFMSTTTDKNQVGFFAGDAKASVNFVLDVPKGTHALHIDPIGGGFNKDERELLIQRGSTIVVKSVKISPDGLVTIHGTVVQGAPSAAPVPAPKPKPVLPPKAVVGPEQLGPGYSPFKATNPEGSTRASETAPPTGPALGPNQPGFAATNPTLRITPAPLDLSTAGPGISKVEAQNHLNAEIAAAHAANLPKLEDVLKLHLEDLNQGLSTPAEAFQDLSKTIANPPKEGPAPTVLTSVKVQAYLNGHYGLINDPQLFQSLQTQLGSGKPLVDVVNNINAAVGKPPFVKGQDVLVTPKGGPKPPKTTPAASTPPSTPELVAAFTKDATTAYNTGKGALGDQLVDLKIDLKKGVISPETAHAQYTALTGKTVAGSPAPGGPIQATIAASPPPSVIAGQAVHAGAAPLPFAFNEANVSSYLDQKFSDQFTTVGPSGSYDIDTATKLANIKHAMENGSLTPKQAMEDAHGLLGLPQPVSQFGATPAAAAHSSGAGPLTTGMIKQDIVDATDVAFKAGKHDLVNELDTLYAQVHAGALTPAEAQIKLEGLTGAKPAPPVLKPTATAPSAPPADLAHQLEVAFDKAFNANDQALASSLDKLIEDLHVGAITPAEAHASFLHIQQTGSLPPAPASVAAPPTKAAPPLPTAPSNVAKAAAQKQIDQLVKVSSGAYTEIGKDFNSAMTSLGTKLQSGAIGPNEAAAVLHSYGYTLPGFNPPAPSKIIPPPLKSLQTPQAVGFTMDQQGVGSFLDKSYVAAKNAGDAALQTDLIRIKNSLFTGVKPEDALTEAHKLLGLPPPYIPPPPVPPKALGTLPKTAPVQASAPFKADNAAWNTHALRQANVDKAAVTADERASLSNYKGSGYIPMNDYMRLGTHTSARNIDDVNRLTAAIDRAVVPVDLKVRRGVNMGAGKLGQEQTYLEWAAAKPGDVIVDNAFMSVTTNDRTHHFFSGSGSRSVVFELDLPAGTKGYSLDPHVGGEDEIILQRGSGVVVTSVGRDKQGRLLIHGRLIQP